MYKARSTHACTGNARNSQQHTDFFQIVPSLRNCRSSLLPMSVNDVNNARKTLAICGPCAPLALNCPVQQNSVVFNITDTLIESCKGYRRKSKFASENLFWKLPCACVVTVGDLN